MHGQQNIKTMNMSHRTEEKKNVSLNFVKCHSVEERLNKSRRFKLDYML